ncbi:hypothetical protein D3C72_2536180 [compost metagenome]
MGEAPLHLLALLGRQRAQHIFAGQFFEVVSGAFGHPMPSRNAARLRLIQDFTVPNGAPSLLAISAWE